MMEKATTVRERKLSLEIVKTCRYSTSCSMLNNVKVDYKTTVLPIADGKPFRARRLPVRTVFSVSD